MVIDHGYFRRKAKKEAAVTPHSFLPFVFDSQRQQTPDRISCEEGKKWQRQDKLGREGMIFFFFLKLEKE